MTLAEIGVIWRPGYRLYFQRTETPANKRRRVGTFHISTVGTLSYMNASGNDSRLILNAKDLSASHFKLIDPPQ